MGRLKKIWYGFLIIFCLSVAGLVFNMQVVEVGENGICLLVKKGDIISHEFIHSMYDVPVVERFKVENGSLNLFHVDSPSDAALEYYMIEKRNEGNVNRAISEFCIPTSSIGKHILKINDKSISIATSQTGDRCVRIRLTWLPLVHIKAYLKPFRKTLLAENRE